MNEKEAKERLKKGWIHILVTFQVIGSPAKHVDESLRKFLDKAKEDKRIYWLEENVGQAEQTGEGKDAYYSAYAEVDMLVQNLETMMWLSLEFMPSSMEIIEPLEFEYTAGDLQNWVNDVLAKLHVVSAHYKQQTLELEFLKTNFSKLVQNTILVSLTRGEKSLPELVKDTTLVQKVLEANISKLLTEKKIKEKKGVYSLA